MHELDFRITDLSGEQYYFKEAALALSRTLRRARRSSTSGIRPNASAKPARRSGRAMRRSADAACRKGYAHGPQHPVHMAQ